MKSKTHFTTVLHATRNVDRDVTVSCQRATGFGIADAETNEQTYWAIGDMHLEEPLRKALERINRI